MVRSRVLEYNGYTLICVCDVCLSDRGDLVRSQRPRRQSEKELRGSTKTVSAVRFRHASRAQRVRTCRQGQRDNIIDEMTVLFVLYFVLGAVRVYHVDTF